MGVLRSRFGPRCVESIVRVHLLPDRRDMGGASLHPVEWTPASPSNGRRRARRRGASIGDAGLNRPEGQALEIRPLHCRHLEASRRASSQNDIRNDMPVQAPIRLRRRRRPPKLCPGGRGTRGLAGRSRSRRAGCVAQLNWRARMRTSRGCNPPTANCKRRDSIPPLR